LSVWGAETPDLGDAPQELSAVFDESSMPTFCVPQ
jgi:hypothetical protein